MASARTRLCLRLFPTLEVMRSPTWIVAFTLSFATAALAQLPPSSVTARRPLSEIHEEIGYLKTLFMVVLPVRS